VTRIPHAQEPRWREVSSSRHTSASPLLPCERSTPAGSKTCTNCNHVGPRMWGVVALAPQGGGACPTGWLFRRLLGWGLMSERTVGPLAPCGLGKAPHPHQSSDIKNSHRPCSLSRPPNSWAAGISTGQWGTPAVCGKWRAHCDLHIRRPVHPTHSCITIQTLLKKTSQRQLHGESHARSRRVLGAPPVALMEAVVPPEAGGLASLSIPPKEVSGGRHCSGAGGPSRHAKPAGDPPRRAPRRATHTRPRFRPVGAAPCGRQGCLRRMARGHRPSWPLSVRRRRGGHHARGARRAPRAAHLCRAPSLQPPPAQPAGQLCLPRLCAVAARAQMHAARHSSSCRVAILARATRARALTAPSCTRPSLPRMPARPGWTPPI
jgi:hypothetical protein